MKSENKHLSHADVEYVIKEIRLKLKKGVPTAEIKEYLMEKYNYEPTTAEMRISRARKAIREYYEQDKKHFAEDFHEKYSYLYQKLVEDKQYVSAGKILDSQIKLSGLLNETATVQLDKDSKVTISFGFNDNKEEE